MSGTYVRACATCTCTPNNHMEWTEHSPHFDLKFLKNLPILTPIWALMAPSAPEDMSYGASTASGFASGSESELRFMRDGSVSAPESRSGNLNPCSL